MAKKAVKKPTKSYDPKKEGEEPEVEEVEVDDDDDEIEEPARAPDEVPDPAGGDAPVEPTVPPPAVGSRTVTIEDGALIIKED